MSSCINVMDVDYFSAARSKCILAECIHRMSIQKHPTQLNLKQGKPERKTSKSQRKCRAICRVKWNCEPGHVTTYSCHGKRRNGGAEELSEGAGTSRDLIGYAVFNTTHNLPSCKQCFLFRKHKNHIIRQKL